MKHFGAIPDMAGTPTHSVELLHGDYEPGPTPEIICRGKDFKFTPRQPKGYELVEIEPGMWGTR